MDLAVTANGEVIVFLNTPRGLMPSTPLPTAALLNAQGSEGFAHALAAADFDGDGRADLAVGVAGAAQGEGRVVLFRGFGAGLLPAGDILRPAAGGDRPRAREFGSALAVGDLDGDGRKDLAVGAPGTSRGTNQVGSGAVFLFRGTGQAPTGRSVLLREGTRLNDQLVGLAAQDAGDRLGSALGVGDFNGDGRDDLAVGAPGNTLADGGLGVGTVFVFRANGSRLQLDRRLRQLATPARMDASAGASSSDASDGFGSALTVGDFNGDKKDDLAVGAPRASLSETAFMIPTPVAPPLAPPGALSATPASRGGNEPASTQPPSGGGLIGFLVNPLLGLLTGLSDPMQSPRDVTRGPEDVTMGVRAGAVFVFRGTSLGLEADRALDSHLILRPGSSERASNQPGDRFGAALAAGDFDGDQLDDLAVGAPGEAVGAAARGDASRSGAVFLFRGKSTGLMGDLALSSATGGLAVPAAGDEFGGAAAAADLDKDGRAELAVAAPGKSAQSGRALGNIFVFGGTSSGLRASQRIERFDPATAEPSAASR